MVTVPQRGSIYAFSTANGLLRSVSWECCGGETATQRTPACPQPERPRSHWSSGLLWTHKTVLEAWNGEARTPVANDSHPVGVKCVSSKMRPWTLELLLEPQVMGVLFDWKCREPRFPKISVFLPLRRVCKHLHNSNKEFNLGSLSFSYHEAWRSFSTSVLTPYHKQYIPNICLCILYLQNPLRNLISQPIKIKFHRISCKCILLLAKRQGVGTLISHPQPCW